MAATLLLLAAVVLVALPAATRAGCPYSGLPDAYSVQFASLSIPAHRRALHAAMDPSKVGALETGADWAGVKADIAALLTDSKDFWPADFGNYGPFMIRLAWHCAGSYRTSDGRGGCDGGRIRFDPERSWPDNTNLDKARTLLWPIKQKYGSRLSWADLIVLTGNVAIESMGGPPLPFCAGRTDDADGTDSLPLGPTPEQALVAPCPVQGDCPAPLGPTTMGLIYVNPEGPMGKPDPAGSAPQIRDSFGRMGMDDALTVALIGGGHAFGKTHGACSTGPGPAPRDAPANPWAGNCGNGTLKGKGPNTFTSGFEGAWTETPTMWSNDYYVNLLSYNWEVHIGPGGHNQWRPTPLNGTDQNATMPNIIMLTADVALLHDPSYKALVQLYAANKTALETAFAHAWYQLTTRDMGPATRCTGPLTAPAQAWQNPLPPPPTTKKPNYGAVRKAITKALTASSDAMDGDDANGAPYYGALFATLAYQCASTFRRTDYTGGCDGARIRFSPQKDWPANAGLENVLKVLEPIKSKYGSVTYADLIVLAGEVAVEQAGGKDMAFCGGRTDATSGTATGGHVVPPHSFPDPIIEARDRMAIMGLTPRQAVALAARLRSPSRQEAMGYSGSWTADPSKLSNEYFKVLLGETWEKTMSTENMTEYKAQGKPLYMTPADMALRWDAEFLAIAQEYASSTSTKAFLAEFASGWTKLMNADRYKGPTGSACT